MTCVHRNSPLMFLDMFSWCSGKRVVEWDTLYCVKSMVTKSTFFFLPKAYHLGHEETDWFDKPRQGHSGAKPGQDNRQVRCYKHVNCDGVTLILINWHLIEWSLKYLKVKHNRYLQCLIKYTVLINYQSELQAWTIKAIYLNFGTG